MEETSEALEELDAEPNDVDKIKLTKELADVLYVVIGTAVAFGLPLEKAFKEVHRSNMSKLGADGKPILREDGKVLKGPNYSEADIGQFLS
jgi:predicted HAD superfamily Cof-like phosphohydrolase